MVGKLEYKRLESTFSVLHNVALSTKGSSFLHGYENREKTKIAGRIFSPKHSLKGRYVYRYLFYYY